MVTIRLPVSDQTKPGSYKVRDGESGVTLSAKQAVMEDGIFAPLLIGSIKVDSKDEPH
jgi:hypothetical protein